MKNLNIKTILIGLLISLAGLAYANVTVYPNPTKNGVAVELGELHHGVVAKVKKLDGTLVATKEVGTADRFSMYINAEPGAYYLEVKSNQGFLGNVKVLKQE